MGVIVSKENRDRTKKVQQTAAVVSALKMASKDAKSDGSPTSNDKTLSLQSQTHPDSHEQRNDKFVDRNDDFDREHMGSLNHDKSSLTYGLPELTDSYAHSSGTTGYWNKSDKAVVTIPYFGAWKNRVSICSCNNEYRVRVYYREPQPMLPQLLERKVKFRAQTKYKISLIKFVKMSLKSFQSRIP